eukprot:2348442-Amphidinium_carterae.1
MSENTAMMTMRHTTGIFKPSSFDDMVAHLPTCHQQTVTPADSLSLGKVARCDALPLLMQGTGIA